MENVDDDATIINKQSPVAELSRPCVCVPHPVPTYEAVCGCPTHHLPTRPCACVPHPAPTYEAQHDALEAGLGPRPLVHRNGHPRSQQHERKELLPAGALVLNEDRTNGSHDGDGRPVVWGEARVVRQFFGGGALQKLYTIF